MTANRHQGFDVVTGDLDELLGATDAAPPPRVKRTLAEFLAALDAGDISGFFLEDFDEPMRGRVARRFGLRFLDGSPYGVPEEA